MNLMNVSAIVVATLHAEKKVNADFIFAAKILSEAKRLALASTDYCEVAPQLPNISDALWLEYLTRLGGNEEQQSKWTFFPPLFPIQSQPCSSFARWQWNPCRWQTENLHWGIWGTLIHICIKPNHHLSSAASPWHCRSSHCCSKSVTHCLH